MRKSFLSALSVTLLFAIIVWVYFWLIFAALRSHPNAEDLSLSHPTFTVGRWEFILHTLATYDGRFFLNFLHTITPLAFGNTSAYPVVAVTGILAFVVSLFFFLSSVISARIASLVLLSLLFASVHFAITPSIVHQLYWMSSSLVYLWSWIFLLLCAGSVVRSFTSYNLFQQRIWQSFSIALLPAAVGINELMLPLVSLLTIYCLIKGIDLKRYSFAAVFGFLSFSFVLFFVTSPGISQRLLIENSRAPSQAISDKITISVFHTVSYLLSFYTNSVLIAGVFLLIVNRSLFKIKESIIPLRLRYTQIPIVIIVIFVWLILLPYYLPMGGSEDLLPKRIFNTVCVYVMLITLFSILRSQMIPVRFSMLVRTLASFLLLISFTFFFSHNNIQLIFNDFQSGQLDCYHHEMILREELLKRASEMNTPYKYVETSSIECKPLSVYHPTDMEPHRAKPHWNTAYEMFYDIDEIVVMDENKKNE